MESLVPTPVTPVGPVACFGPESVPLPVAQMSTDQYMRMVETGVLEPGRRVELIDGVIVPMSPAGYQHNALLIRLLSDFVPVLDRFKAITQGTLKVAEGHVYDPDFMLLADRPDRYRNGHPTPGDVRLLAEASASSLRRDSNVKLPVYSAVGIEEYWIADLERDALIVHRDPRDRAYQTVTEHSGDDLVTPLACPELAIRVGDLFA